ncbi:Glucan endo-1,3-beta-glucosidase 5 [Sesamum angolense]|uniref:Glucan endo-1,3-beta-glucosidase 5 n=1 Tax=Sesamum angolense TaxID=2727404 RepID=A0AAE2BKU2_9LAMI|nr:Glucan endo-1,3-beta-glucosidase 5 [Sesamum angolense]
MGLLGMKYGLSVTGVVLFLMVNTVQSIGANWGTQATHPLHPSIIVKLLKDNGIQKVKLFDAEATVLNALSGSGIEVMVGIPNDMLSTLANSVDAAEKWVERNVSAHVSSNSVDIRIVFFANSVFLAYIDSYQPIVVIIFSSELRRDSCYCKMSMFARIFICMIKNSSKLPLRWSSVIGNEPFLSTYNGTFQATTLPALQNIQAALIKAGLGNRVKVTVPLNADVYQSSTEQPSTGDFRSNIHDLMVQIVSFLSLNGAPFTVNIYPFISLYNDPNFPVDYAFFDGYSSPIVDNGRTYTNVFDANYDTLFWALQKNGFGNMTIIVGEIGWPTDGDRNANIGYAQRFNQGFMSHMNVGTPMRPGPVDAYLFSLIDEDAKSIQPGNFERHWGIFNYDGTPKYNLSLGSSNSRSLVPASNVHYLPRRWCVLSPSANLEDPQVGLSVSYACAHADCTSLGYGTSCANLDAQGNISYAFNSYYQINNQLESACRFPNLSVITTTDPSVGTCRFDIMIQTAANQRNGGLSLEPLGVLVQILVFLSALLLL